MNPFQSQFPLSSRKFWKKFLPNIIPTIIVTLIFSGFLGFVFPLLLQQGGLQASYLETTYLQTGIHTTILGTIILTIVILLIYAWYYRLYIRNYFYEGGESFITIKKRVFTPREIHVQYQKIQDVYVDQDLLDRIMGLYDVHIASATVASGMEAHIDGVDTAVAQGLKNFFLQKIQSPGQPVNTTENTIESPGSPNPAPRAAQFTEEISDKTYPIQSVWLLKMITGGLFTSLFIALIIGGYVSLGTTEDTFLIPFLPTFLGIFIVYFLVHTIGIFIWKANYRFQFMPEFVEFHTGILSQSDRHLPYRSIQDVSTNQSLFDRIFGLVNVTIENAAQASYQSSRGSGRQRRSNNIVIVGQTPQNANKIVEALKPVIVSSNSSQTGL